MTHFLKIFVAQNCAPADIKAIWSQVPNRVQGLFATLKEVNLIEEKPSLEALLNLHECRLLWDENEVYLRRVQRATQQGLQQQLHAVVCDASAGFRPNSSNFKEFPAEVLNPGQLYISRFFQATQGQGLDPADLKAQYPIETRHLKVKDTFYEQWLSIPKEVAA